MEKMTIEEFIKIKDQLKGIYDEASNKYAEIKEEEFYEEFYREYSNFQDKLLNSELSDIPFELWEGISLISSPNTRIIDLSNTKANIDFKLLEDVAAEVLIAHGCNIRNLQNSYCKLYEDNFDIETVQKFPNLFLSSLFSKNIKDKFASNTLKFSDLYDMDEDQLNELKEKGVGTHIDIESDKKVNLNNVMKYLDIKTIRKLYEDNFDAIVDMNNVINWYEYHDTDEYRKKMENFYSRIKSTNDVNEIIKIVREELFSRIVNAKYRDIRFDEYTEGFKDTYPNLFLIDVDVPEDVKERFFRKKLSLDDLINYNKILNSIPLNNFIDDFDIKKIVESCGMNEFLELINNHSIIFSRLLNLEENNRYLMRLPHGFKGMLEEYFNLARDNNPNFNREDVFAKAVSTYLIKNYEDIIFEEYEIIDENGMTKKGYHFPSWVSSLNYNVIEKIETIEDFNNLKKRTVVMDQRQNDILSSFGIHNLQQFEKETGFFSFKKYEYSKELQYLDMIGNFLNNSRNNNKFKKTINESYEQFQNNIALMLLDMKKANFFTDYPDYDFIDGKFRDNHPEIFIDINAPIELRNAFYKRQIQPKNLKEHRDWIKYLIGKDLPSTIRYDFEASCYTSIRKGAINDKDKGYQLTQKFSFMDFYITKHGDEEFLNLIADYGDLSSDLSHDAFDVALDKEGTDRQFRRAIYNGILRNSNMVYDENLPEIFKKEYPDIFLESSVDQTIKDSFYTRSLTFENIRLNPNLVNILKNKNLKVAFSKYNQNKTVSFNSINNKKNSEFDLIDVLGNEKFLKLISSYGMYFEKISESIDFKENISEEELKSKIEKVIYDNSAKGIIKYQENAPEFLKKAHPELFLDDDAPQELKDYFYQTNSNYQIDFSQIKKHQDWLPYLQNKSLKAAFLKKNYQGQRYEQYFDLLGDNALKLAVNKTETVDKMIGNNQIQLLNDWYNLTGKKFVPDYVVMQGFPINQADKYFTNAKSWSRLMKNPRYNKTQDTKDVLLKLSYSFGVFDGDMVGQKKLDEFLNGIPRTLNVLDSGSISSIDDLETTSNPTFRGKEYYDQLRGTLKQDGIIVKDDIGIFSQLYRKNEDGSFTLSVNSQDMNKSKELIRSLFELYPNSKVIDTYKAHQIFGGFAMQYDPTFRDFLLNNMEDIISKPEYTSYIASIQKQFSEIKAINSNRVLTLDLAISYVQTNRFVNVNVGNERLSEVSSIAGYSQKDFDTLQQIYNHGKVRVFSSIPRVEKTEGKYTYEILRLDDPLAVAIGTLTDCCQELGNAAEMSMEHSMVDKHGRVFVIKDENGQPIAQSWVWRNKNVVCFDNIEVPEKAFTRATRENPNNEREGFTDEIYNLYKMAAHDLIEQDEMVYKKLLDEGKITVEQYEGLRIKKVTVGLGYNDIAASIKRNTNMDSSKVARPLEFTPPVPLQRGIYTSDSTVQYVLEEIPVKQEYNGDTPTVHNDEYIEYTNQNIKPQQLLTLEKLELITKKDNKNLHTAIQDYEYDESKLVSLIGGNYGLNPSTTRIMMNPNFGIIYEIQGKQVKIADLLFNTVVDNGEQKIDISKQVEAQIRLALNQLSKDEVTLNAESLEGVKKEMFNKVMGLSEELDEERGVGHASR